MRKSSIVILGLAIVLAVVLGLQSNGETTETAVQGSSKSKSEGQTEAEFQKLMPITGKVKTYFGEYELELTIEQTRDSGFLIICWMGLSEGV